MAEEKRVKAHITSCICGRINICDEDRKEHEKICKEGGEIEFEENSERLKDSIGIVILANERGYILE
jgi:hypothetical protein